MRKRSEHFAGARPLRNHVDTGRAALERATASLERGLRAAQECIERSDVQTMQALHGLQRDAEVLLTQGKIDGNQRVECVHGVSPV
jgi:hypothetical protein